jgi:hypothetical protein
MDKWVDKPRSFGEILDLTFLVLRKHFAKIFSIMLILAGPILLVQAMAMFSGGLPFLPGGGANTFSTFDEFLMTFESTGMTEALATVGGMELVILIITLFLLIIILLPVAMASIMILTGRVKTGEPIEIGSIIKQAFSRFWAMLGGSIVYFLVTFGLIIVPAIIFPLVFALGAFDFGPFLIVISVLLGLCYLFGVVYLMTRWGFYFTALVFEKVSPGLTRSWRLTRGQFWRLLGLYIVLNIIVSILTTGLQIVSDMVLAGSIIGYLLYTLISAISYLIMNVAYAVIYFDLRVRNDATDLQEMVESFEPTTTIDMATESTIETEVHHDDKNEHDGRR